MLKTRVFRVEVTEKKMEYEDSLVHDDYAANFHKASQAVVLFVVILVVYITISLIISSYDVIGDLVHWIQAPNRHKAALFPSNAPKMIGLIFEFTGGPLPLEGLLSYNYRKHNTKNDRFNFIIGFLYIICGRIVENAFNAYGLLAVLVIIVSSFFLLKLANTHWKWLFIVPLSICMTSAFMGY